MNNLNRFISWLGILLVASAVGKAAYTITTDELIIEALIDFLLLSVPGIVMAYLGFWLPSSEIDPSFYSRILAWAGGGVGVMALLYGLRILHPGVEVGFAFGTQAASLAIGLIAGLSIGINEAQARTHAKTLREQNEELRQKRAIEHQNAELKRTEQRLEEAVTQLELSNEKLEQFAYAASHDLQEPLRMVTSYLHLIERRYADELDEDGEEFIHFARDGAERMRAMIDGLLEFSRVETRGDQFDWVELNDVLDDVLVDLQFSIGETNAKITRDPLPEIRGDRSQLQQLFQNLVANAIEYTGEGTPRIHVSAAADGETWTISVRDNGIGIDPDDTDRIFDFFQRLHSIDEHTGSGIGLALCKRIVERHNGEIWVESEPGEGSTFFFTIPSRGEPADTLSTDTRLKSSGI